MWRGLAGISRLSGRKRGKRCPYGATPQLIGGDFNFPLDDLLQAPPMLQRLLLTRRLVEADSELAAPPPPFVHTSGCREDAPPALTGCWWRPA